MPEEEGEGRKKEGNESRSQPLVHMRRSHAAVRLTLGPESPASTYNTALYPVGEPDRPVTTPVMSEEPPTGGNDVSVLQTIAAEHRYEG